MAALNTIPASKPTEQPVPTHRSPSTTADVIAETELLDAPGGSTLRLRFPGPFEGRTVTWDATFLALAAPEGHTEAATSVGNFIEIGEDGANGTPIRVGLQVARIDVPTIRKTIIMIRRYKRLCRGRHDYGAGLSPTASASQGPSG